MAQNPVTLDMSTAQPISAAPAQPAPVTLDMSTATPISGASAPAASSALNGPVATFLGNAGEGGAEAAGDIWNAVKGTVKSAFTPSGQVAAAKGIWDELPPVQLTKHLQQTLPIINAYEKARASGASISDAIKASDIAVKQHVANMSVLPTIVSDFETNPTKETARVLVDGVALATSMLGGPEAAAGADEAATAARMARTAEPADVAGFQRPNPFRRALASPQAAGETATQPAAQQAVRTAVQTASDNAGTAAANIQTNPLVSRGETILDDHLAALRGQEQAAYTKMDKTAGFDVKAEKTQLSNDQYKLGQLGNTDADNAAREKLTESIADSKSRIADAEAKMQAAGVDPKAADRLHQSRKAGEDFKKGLVQATSSDGQTVDVDSLLNTSKKLQFNKYGNRLAEFFGSPEAADKFMTDLETAQKAGETAMSRRALRNTILKYVLPTGAGIAIGAEGIRHFTE